MQLTHDGTGTDADALVARIERLETTVKQLRAQGVGSATSVPKDPATGRAVLGGAARRPDRAETRIADRPPPEAPAEAHPVAGGSSEVVGASPAAAPEPAADPRPTAAVSVPEAWEQSVKSQVKPLVRALYSAGSFVGNRGDTWLFSVPNEAHGSKCDEHRADVEAALSAAVGSAVTIEFVSGGSPVADAEPAHAAPPVPPTVGQEPSPTASSSGARVATTSDRSADEQSSEAAPHVPEADEDVDLHELTDAPPESVKTPIDRLAEAFPGSELMTDD